MHASAPASDWVIRFARQWPKGALVLDVACGSGRHMRWLNEHGHTVTGVDRDPQALEVASAWGDTLRADLEAPGAAWPLGQRQFDAVVVTHYLWRPLWPHLKSAVKPGGWLVYETFAWGNARFGKPSRDDFLLQPSELLEVFADWHVVAFEQGVLEQPQRQVQRMAARRLSRPLEHPLNDPLSNQP
ncbi:MAG: class I SAM-dependent methyltransferase [Betaproteobacteria bacterium]|jgi:SAM-dependent methyltransferase|nr:class I SAM-dependent methyltransferase [Betaproteobacteria bacterium]NBP44700.1 class I SAM-dependent methyltransferase [Betaproteobacteria bacterium]